MRPEKEYLIEETADHLEKSNYFFITDYQGIRCRRNYGVTPKLSERGAEFHVVKNSSLNSWQQLMKDYEGMSDYLSGHTAIVVGGDDASRRCQGLWCLFQGKR